MSNDPKVDLLYAILAMDSYNRGYGAGIDNLGVSSDTETYSIGNWVIDKKDASFVFDQEAFNAGFYAIAYKNTATDEVVISYRGTDFNVRLPGGIWDGEYVFDSVLGGSDLTNGYGLALGLDEADLDQTLGPAQAQLATQFYDAIAEAHSGTITLTGHSLGGGLAGLVAGIYNRSLLAVDPMQFGKAVRKCLIGPITSSPLFQIPHVENALSR